MKKRSISMMMCTLMAISALAGCGSATVPTETQANSTEAAKTETAMAEAATTAAESNESETKADNADTNYEFTEDMTLICPFKAGGDTDRNTRYLAEAMSRIAGVNVVVQNVDGGASVMGMQECLDAKPDGNTMVVNGTDIFVPYMQGNSDITIDSFKTVGITHMDNTTVLAVNKTSGWTTLDDLLKAAQAEPDTIEYGGKIGVANQICGIAMNNEWNAGLKFVDVGNNAAKMTALLGEQTDVINISYSLAGDYFSTGEFIPLVLLGAEKNELLPQDIPVGEDLGLKNLDFSKFFWIGTSPDVPDEKVEALTNLLEQVCQDETFQQELVDNYLTLKFMPGQEAADFANKMYEETLLPYKDQFLAAQ